MPQKQKIYQLPVMNSDWQPYFHNNFGVYPPPIDFQ